MPYTTEYRDNCLYRDWTGLVTGNELFDALESAMRDVMNGQQIDKTFYDFSAVSAFDVSTEDILMYSDKCVSISKLTPNVKMVVVAQTDISFGVSRMWEMLVDKTEWKIKIFRSRESAESWLNA